MKTKKDIYNYLEKNKFVRNNGILKNIIEKYLHSDFFIVDSKKILYASPKYKMFINESITNELSKIIKTENSSGGRLSFRITDKFTVNGPVYFSVIDIDNRKAMIIVKYNKKYFSSEDISIINELKNNILLP